MSRYAPNCKWCGDRPGGCLHCVEELSENDAEKLLAIRQMIDRGEVHVLAVRHSEEVLLRPVGARSGRSDAPRSPHAHHVWAHDGVNFKSRHCTAPGCGARQKFVWLPEDANVCGKWIDESADAGETPAARSRRPGSKRKKRI